MKKLKVGIAGYELRAHASKNPSNLSAIEVLPMSAPLFLRALRIDCSHAYKTSPSIGLRQNLHPENP